MEMNSQVVIGHRGAAGLAPENTLAAVRTAVARGVQYVEIDIQRTRDGIIVLMHDRSVDRTTNGKGNVADLEWPELQKLDAGSKFSQTYMGEGIPRLEEILKWGKETGVIIVIEVKYPDLSPGLAVQVNELIEKLEANQHVVVMSFDLIFMHQLADLQPNFPLGCIYYLPPMLKSAELSFAQYISMHWLCAYFFPRRLRGLQALGLSIWAWTINRKDWIHRRACRSFNGIITDFP